MLGAEGYPINRNRVQHKSKQYRTIASDGGA
jgi:hypothetical protein